MSRWWYFTVYLLLPYIVVSLAWRGLRYRLYWRRWPERFGCGPDLTHERVVWIHAVSVGEVRSAAPLIDAIADDLPHHRIVVSTMTPTGAEQVEAIFGSRVTHTYVPYDFPDAVARFLDRLRPELAVVAETEFWPNLFAACATRGIPINLVNVRMSAASFRGYSRVPLTVERMLSHATLICAQTGVDAQRLRNLGVDHRRIHVTGNLKFDVPVPQYLVDEGRALRALWGGIRPVVIAASTHPGEESQVLGAFERLRSRYSNLLLIIVPRHPERFEAVARLVQTSGFHYARRSRCPQSLPSATAVLIGDTMGELHRLYAAADVAFVGGSLVRHGGQNLLEAFSVGVPVIVGPHMFHFEEISAMALDRGAALQVRDAEGLADAVALLLDQPDVRLAAVKAACSMLADNRGALERTIGLMRSRSPGPLDLAASVRRRALGHAAAG